MHRAVLGVGAVGEGLDLFLLGDVDLDGDRLSAAFADPGGDLLSRLRLQVRDDDAHAARRAFVGEAAADPLRGAGHHRHPIA